MKIPVVPLIVFDIGNSKLSLSVRHVKRKKKWQLLDAIHRVVVVEHREKIPRKSRLLPLALSRFQTPKYACVKIIPGTVSQTAETNVCRLFLNLERHWRKRP